MESRFYEWRKAWEQYLVGSGHDCNDLFEQTLTRNLEIQAGAAPEKFGFADGFHHAASLQALALAYRIPGNAYSGREDVKERILTELQDISANLYNADSQVGAIENWWPYEVGIPLRLFNVLILMYDEGEAFTDMIPPIVETFLGFQDAYSKSARGKKETGANLVWKSHNQILAGILTENMELIETGCAALPSVFRYSHKMKVPGFGEVVDDGFYEDGSFIQHYMFAYTGGYGKHMLSVISGLLCAFGGESGRILPEESREFLYDMIPLCYEPLIWKGHFMDIARGREVARPWLQDDGCGKIVMRSLFALAQNMPEERKTRMEKMLLSWLPEEKDLAALLSEGDPHTEYVAFGSLTEIFREFSAKYYRNGKAVASELPEMEPHHYDFHVMAKPVHREKDYAFAISMYNRTTACYERLGNEGDTFWHFSDGQTYLYNADADAFSGDYYGTVDMQRLPGTTVERTADREKDPYYSWYLPEARNMAGYADSLSDGKYGIVTEVYCGQGNGKERSLKVRKSWLCTGKEIVCLGSGITSDTQNDAETIVENRKIRLDGSNEISVNGEAPVTCESMFGTKVTKPVTTIHLEGSNGAGADIGYYFPEKPELNLLCEKRNGVWAYRDGREEEEKVNSFATFWFSHGKHPENASYSYVILPGASSDETTEYAENPDIRVICCNDKVHAVENIREKVTGICFFEAGTVEELGISSDGPALVLICGEGAERKISVLDPAGTEKLPVITGLK